MNIEERKFLLNQESKIALDDLYRLYKNKDCLSFILHIKGGACVCTCGREMKPIKNRDKMYGCSSCKKQQSLLRGTIFHRTKLPLRKWLQCIYEITINKNGISHITLAKKLGVNIKTAYTMCRKIRDFLIEKVVPNKEMLSGDVEVDETYMASKKLPGKKGWGSSRRMVVGVVSRQTGKLYMEQAERINGKTLCGFIKKYVKKGSHIHSDELSGYKPLTKKYGFNHSTVCHSKREYVKFDEKFQKKTHTNTIEGVWSCVERFINGTMMDVGHTYIEQYLAEVMLRYNFRKIRNLWGLLCSWCVVG